MYELTEKEELIRELEKVIDKHTHAKESCMHLKEEHTRQLNRAIETIQDIIRVVKGDSPKFYSIGNLVELVSRDRNKVLAEKILPYLK